MGPISFVWNVVKPIVAVAAVLTGAKLIYDNFINQDNKNDGQNETTVQNEQEESLQEFAQDAIEAVQKETENLFAMVESGLLSFTDNKKSNKQITTSESKENFSLTAANNKEYISTTECVQNLQTVGSDVSYEEHESNDEAGNDDFEQSTQGTATTVDSTTSNWVQVVTR